MGHRVKNNCGHYGPLADPTDEYVYYNLNLVNNTDVSQPCQFVQQLNGSILDDARDYYIAVIRFVIDGSTIPIFTYPPDDQFGKTPYLVTLKVQNPPIPNPSGIYQTYVPYIPDYNSYESRSVYTYQNFVRAINQAFNNLYNDMQLDYNIPVPTPLGSGPPIMMYNQDKSVPGTCTLNIPEQYVNPTAFPPGKIQVFMNTRLFSFFGNYDSKFYGEGLTNGMDYEILVQNNLGLNVVTYNSLNYYSAFQEYNSSYLWFDTTSVQFISNLLGVVPEYVPLQNISTNSLASTSNAGVGPSSTPLLTDFQPYYGTNDVAGPRGYLFYSPSSQWKFANMARDSINSIDINVILRNRVGEQTQYFIPPKQSAQLKIAFVKRNAHTGKD